MAFNRSNSLLSEKRLQTHEDNTLRKTQAMTVNGTLNKVLLGLITTGIGAYFGWNITEENINNVYLLSVVGFILAFATIYMPRMAFYTIWPYALCQGFVLSAISSLIEGMMPGVASQALLGTGIVFLVIFVSHRSGLIRTTRRERKIVLHICMALLVLHIINILFSIFGKQGPLHDIMYGLGSGWLSIGFSLFMIVLGCFMLLMDLERIEAGANRLKLPKQMEWYCAFSLLITVFWVYFEILKLVVKRGKSA